MDYLEIDETGLAIGGIYQKMLGVDEAEYVNWREITGEASLGWVWDFDTSEWGAPEAPLVTLKDLRTERDALLASTDFTQLKNSSLTEVEVTDWATYRQALRDMPAAYIPVSEPEYPVSP
jgi:hypothetical protein